MVIAKFLEPNVVQLANTETGVVVRKAHVSQVKIYQKKGAVKLKILGFPKILGLLRGRYLNRALSTGSWNQQELCVASASVCTHTV